MAEPPSTIRNLGPASDKAFAKAGIDSAEDIRALGADAAYLRLLETGTRPHFIGYYALVMGLQGRPWNDCRDAEKDALKARFEALKARAIPAPDSPGLDQALSEIGVIALPHGAKKRG